MGKFVYFIVTCGLLVSICFCFERQAYAYVDPGSSLVLFQGVSSVFIGVLYYFRKRLKSLLRRSKVAEAAENGDLH
jgi:FtsH-binding integral membrane protein